MLEIKKILVPTDFSPPAARALEYACGLALPFHSQLLVVHVIPPNSYPLSKGGSQASSSNLRKEIRKRIEQNLATLIKGLDGKVTGEARTYEGTVYEELLGCANREHVDLIVLGTHGHTGIAHFIHGSTVERVVRLATCPVLILRAPD